MLTPSKLSMLCVILVIGGIGRLFGTILLTLEGNFLRLEEYGSFYVLVGIGLVILLVAMAYKDKIERFFKHLHGKKHLKKDESS